MLLDHKCLKYIVWLTSHINQICVHVQIKKANLRYFMVVDCWNWVTCKFVFPARELAQTSFHLLPPTVPPCTFHLSSLNPLEAILVSVRDATQWWHCVIIPIIIIFSVSLPCFGTMHVRILCLAPGTARQDGVPHDWWRIEAENYLLSPVVHLHSIKGAQHPPLATITCLLCTLFPLQYIG